MGMKRTTSSQSIGYYGLNRKINVLSPDMKNLCSCDAARLEDELVQLRESTKKALKSSWDEVELIQKTNLSQANENTNLKTEIAKLMKELSNARDREKDLVRRNDKLVSNLEASRNTPFYKSVFPSRRRSTDAVAHNNTMDPGPRRNSMVSDSVQMESFSKSSPLLVVHNDDEDSDTAASSAANSILDFLGLPSSLVKGTGPPREILKHKSNPEMGRETTSEKDIKIEELKFKLKSRDDVIISMEETITEHIKNMQLLHVTLNTRRGI
jgi:hypothetical protein